MRPSLLLQARKYRMNDNDAEDTVQDVLCKLWMIREQLDEYRSIEALATTILRNLCFNKLRYEYREIPLDTKDAEYTDNEAADREEQEEQIQTLLQLVDKLPDTQQAVLRMKHVDGMEVKDIAGIIGCTEDAVRMNLSRARKRIKELFFNERRP